MVTRSKQVKRQLVVQQSQIIITQQPKIKNDQNCSSNTDWMPTKAYKMVTEEGLIGSLTTKTERVKRTSTKYHTVVRLDDYNIVV